MFRFAILELLVVAKNNEYIFAVVEQLEWQYKLRLKLRLTTDTIVI